MGKADGKGDLMTWARLSRWLATVMITAAVSCGAAAAEMQAQADVACQPAAKKLQYDCIIKLTDTRTNEPLAGIDVMVGAAMPSMPMAHHVRPVKATAAAAPGSYQASIQLEMYGDWALQLDLTGRVRDRVVKSLRFESDRVSPR